MISSIQKLLFLFVILYSLSSTIFASNSNFSINKVNVECLNQEQCSSISDVFSSLERSYSGQSHFYNVFKLYVANEGVKALDFQIVRSENRNILNINLIRKKRILTLEGPFFGAGNEVEFPSIIPLKVDDYLDLEKIKETERLYKSIARDKGYPNVEVRIETTHRRDGVIVKTIVNLNDAIITQKINFLSKSSFLKEYLRKKIMYHEGKAFDLSKIKFELESLRKLFIQFGYYLVDFNFRYKKTNKQSVELYIEILNTARYGFYIKNSDHKSKTVNDHEGLKRFLSENLISSKRELSSENIRTLLGERFLDQGFRNSEFKIRELVSTDMNGDSKLIFEIELVLGAKSRISQVRFKGNNHFTSLELLSLFNVERSELAQVGIFDHNHYSNFKIRLREKYISNGFLSVLVDKPVITRDRPRGIDLYGLKNDESYPLNLTFKIREGIRTKVSTLLISGLKDDENREIKKMIHNKVTKPFNPILFKEDLSSIVRHLKNKGYYYAKITNLNTKDIVKYISDNTKVVIRIDIDSGPKIFADDIIIIGNEKTRKTLIKRQLHFKSGSLITSNVLEKSQLNLLSLGLFSAVQIKPVSQNKKKTDVLIFLREKDFGSVEFAPGIRTDIGFKLSSSIAYNNIDGLNKKISLHADINKRFDLNSLDEKRRSSGKVLLEYNAALNFSENHIFHSDWNFSTSFSQARKRLYSYDVDIARVNYTFSRDLTSWLNFSLKQQLEMISQFNSTDTINHGHFKIGSITPAIKLDFRDRIINSRSGALISLSMEVANSNFFSQSDDDLVVDYHKIINRNKFYVPIGDRTVFAVSTSFGIQENNATDITADNKTEGYIPGIKVFRLSGADIVRGYEDEEINTLISGEDISDVEVNSRAYMVNLKLEPRFNISDSMILGLFYDAGRVFVDDLELDQLRSSVGISFKFVTPVGTLDIDYGIKTLRKEDSSGKLESPGKLHVSIGFF